MMMTMMLLLLLLPPVVVVIRGFDDSISGVMLFHVGTEACATAEPVFALRASKPFAKLLRSLCLLEATQFLCNFSGKIDRPKKRRAKSNVCMPLAGQKGNIQDWEN